MDNMSHRMSFRPSLGEAAGSRLQPEVFKVRLNQTVEETLQSFQKTWLVAGYEEAECQRLLGEFLSKLQTVCMNEVEAEEKILEHAKKHVEALMQEINELHEQLGRTISMNHLTDLNYTEKLLQLETTRNNTLDEVNGRQAVLNKELEGIMRIVEELGENPPVNTQFQGPPGTPLLSDVRLNLMKDYKKDLEFMRTERIEAIQVVAKECYSLMTDLMYAEEGFNTMPDSQQYLNLDKQIIKFVKMNDFTLDISNKGAARLVTRSKKFIEEKEKRRIELETTGVEIARLWSLLRIPKEEREHFQNSFKSNLSKETLAKGNNELQRLKEIRRRSLGRVVSAIRDDIRTLWEEAGIDNDDNRRREFPNYYNEIESLEDSAVDLHEAYFISLRKRVDELKPILVKISRREGLIRDRIELEELTLNPERLTARGPNAREQRKAEEAMTVRVKRLPELTKEIASQIAVWEEANGPFMYGGERYLERIPQQEEAYLALKEELKQFRDHKNGKTPKPAPQATATGRVGAATVAKKTMPGTPGPNTPYSATKGAGRSLERNNNAITAAANQLPYPAPPPQTPVLQREAENQPLTANIIRVCPSTDSAFSDLTSTTALKAERDRSSNSSDTILQDKN